jgi:hypothetical protein
MLRKKQSKRLLGHEQLDPRVMLSADGLADGLVLAAPQSDGEPLEVRVDLVRIEVDVDRIDEDFVIDLLEDSVRDFDREFEIPGDQRPEFQAGDANRDYEFDQLDIVHVLQGGKYLTGEPADFSQGDFNSDGTFDQLDIVAALQTGNYLQGPYLEPEVDDPDTDEIIEEIDPGEESFEIGNKLPKEQWRYSPYFDSDGDGATDSVYADTDGDGMWDTWLKDKGKDGKADDRWEKTGTRADGTVIWGRHLYGDSEPNGKYDYEAFDKNGDGKPDDRPKEIPAEEPEEVDEMP